MANSTPYIINKPNQDNTGRVLTYDYQAPVYATSLALLTNSYSTVVNVGLLTGVISITADTTQPNIGDKLSLLFTADATSGGHVVTFSTGFAMDTYTVTCAASLYAKAEFTFNGTAWIGSATATA